VPKAAKVNPFGIRLIGIEKQANVSVVANHLITYLNEHNLHNRVKKTSVELASELNLSERTVAETLRTLKRLGMLLEISRGHYFISPKLT
jgi:DNA-binding IclR family transcriptional regulator